MRLTFSWGGQINNKINKYALKKNKVFYMLINKN